MQQMSTCIQREKAFRLTRWYSRSTWIGVVWRGKGTQGRQGGMGDGRRIRYFNRTCPFLAQSQRAQQDFEKFANRWVKKKSHCCLYMFCTRWASIFRIFMLLRWSEWPCINRATQHRTNLPRCTMFRTRNFFLSLSKSGCCFAYVEFGLLTFFCGAGGCITWSSTSTAIGN